MRVLSKERKQEVQPDVLHDNRSIKFGGEDKRSAREQKRGLENQWPQATMARSGCELV